MMALAQVKILSEKWFGPIPAGKPYLRNLPQEPLQKEARRIETNAEVPLDAFYKAWHMPGRTSADYFTIDLMGDILGRGKSSRLYEKLVNDKKIFNNISAYATGSVEPGLIMIDGKLNQGIRLEDAEGEVMQVLEELKKGVQETELAKVKNQAEAILVFEEVELLNRCMNLAMAAELGDPDLVNKDSEKIQAVRMEDMQRVAAQIFKEENSSTMFYYGKK